MPMLSNAKHERFAQALAAGKSADEAYQSAGYAENSGNAATLKGNQRVQARVAELLGRATEGVVLTKQWVLERLIQNADRAMQAESVKDENGEPIGDYHYQGNVANRALELLGKELGMFIERKEVGQPGDFDKLNATELRDLILREAEELGVGLPALEAIGGGGEGRGKPH